MGRAVVWLDTVTLTSLAEADEVARVLRDIASRPRLDPREDMAYEPGLIGAAHLKELALPLPSGAEHS